MKRTTVYIGVVCAFYAAIMIICAHADNLQSERDLASAFESADAIGLAQDAEARARISDKPEPEEAAYVSEPQYVRSYDYASAYVRAPYCESDDTDAEADAKEWIAQRESGGDYEARNGIYIGRYQLNEMYLDGDYSPENQEAAAEAYIADRYGSWQAAREFWEINGWY